MVLEKLKNIDFSDISIGKCWEIEKKFSKFKPENAYYGGEHTKSHLKVSKKLLPENSTDNGPDKRQKLMNHVERNCSIIILSD